MIEATQAPAYSPNWRLMAKLVPALALLAFIIPSSAFGQATRTWVSGVGDDVNPCSRTAPCKTFAGAISKTAAGGEINVLDPGAFGTLTITKSITIDAGHSHAGVLASPGINGIIINAAATDKVKLKGLDINGGSGTGPQTALSGIKVLGAQYVHIKNSEIYKFKAGVAVVPNGASAQPRVRLTDNNIHNNGIGVINAPGNNTIASTNVTMRNNEVHDNTCGAVTSSTGANASTPDASVNCGTGGVGLGISKPAIIRAYHNGFNDNGEGVYARGVGAVFEIAYNEITGNSVYGIHRLNPAIVRTFSPATNVVSDNAASDPPNEVVPLQRR